MGELDVRQQPAVKDGDADNLLPWLRPLYPEAGDGMYAVLLPYVLPGETASRVNSLKSLALPRGLEPLFSP